MDTPAHLTVKQLQDILNKVYDIGSHNKEIEAIDMVNEIKQTILDIRASETEGEGEKE